MKSTIEIKKGTVIELIKPLVYRENIEEVIYTEEIPVGRRGEYLGKSRSFYINVHEDIHPEYINSENMWETSRLIPGGHDIALDDKNGFSFYFTLSDEKFREYVKVVSPVEVE